MVKRKNDRKQSKLGIVTLDSNIPKDHISRFVVDFIDEVYPMLNIKEAKNKKERDSLPIDSMLKLLVYAKIKHMESAKYIADMKRYHEVYRFVSDDVKHSEHSVQRHRREYGYYFEVLVQMALKKASDLKLTDFNHVAIDGTIKKAYNSNNNVITKKKKPKYCSITLITFPLARKCWKNYINLLKKYWKIKTWMLKIK